MKSIEDRIKDAEGGLPVTAYKLREAEALIKTLKEENARLVSAARSVGDDYLNTLAEIATLKARVAELEKNNFRIGLIAAAVVIENKVAEYDYEHGRTEPDTNCRVYPGNGEDYVYSMIELAEELRMIADKEPANEG